MLSTSAMMIHEITPTHGAFNGYGESVAIDGSLAMVGGSEWNERGDNEGPGFAYVFDAVTGKQLHALRPVETNSTFGGPVAISGCTAVVGRFFDGNESPKPIAYVFDATSGQQLRLLQPTDSASPSFAHSVAVNGNRALIGCTASGNAKRGSAYVFDTGTGKQLAKLFPTDATPNPSFGGTVKISANIAMVGSESAAYLFDITTKRQIARLLPIASGSHSSAYNIAIRGQFALFGNQLFNASSGKLIRTLSVNSTPKPTLNGHVTLDERFAAVGGFNVGDDTGESAAVYVFDIATGTYLTKFSKRIEPRGYPLTGPMAISERAVLIGNPLDYDNGDAYEGAAYLFKISDGATGAISGQIFNDLDRDGRLDAGEKGIGGRTLYIDIDDNGQLDLDEPSAVTDSSGGYAINSLVDAYYNVRQILPAGWAQSTPAKGHGLKVTLGVGQSFAGTLHGCYADFGSISGRVFNDLDHDGRLDAGEAGLAGRTLFIDLDDDREKDIGEPSAITNANGWYTIKNLLKGYYNVRQILPAGWHQSTPANRYGFKVNLLAGQNIYSVKHGAYQGFDPERR